MIAPPANLARRLWVYQAERFPVFKHAALIAAFSSCGICLSTLLRHDVQWPAPKAFVVAFVVVFGLFLQLRIADEHKDAEVDARYRPGRPVPRGLVSLQTLRNLALGVAVVQAAACLWLSPLLLGLLAIVWLYFALMSAEFFVPAWLKARPVVYLLSHMAIMPLIDIWVSACDWLPNGGRPPAGLGWFLGLSFFNGLVLEIGRKTWPPEMEQPGVDSYSRAWGVKPALGAWMAALGLALACSVVQASRFIVAPITAGLLVLVLAIAGFVISRFYRAPRRRDAAALENLSGVWVLLCYLGLGLVPLGLELCRS